MWGAATGIDLAERVIRQIADLPERPTFTQAAADAVEWSTSVSL